MVRRMITYYAMLKPERWYEIQQEIRARQVAHASRITARQPLDSPEPDEDEEERGEEKGEELAPMEADDAEQPELELSE